MKYPIIEKIYLAFQRSKKSIGLKYFHIDCLLNAYIQIWEKQKD